MDIHDQYTSEIKHEIAILKTGKANHAILSRSMYIHDQYTSEIKHEIAILKTGKANHAILSRLSNMFEILDDIERVDELWKDDYSDNCRIRG